MSGTVHQLKPADGPQLVTKQQLMRALGRSQRWIEMRVSEGMPSAGFDRTGRKLFEVGAVNVWLERRAKTLIEPRSVTDRVKRLELEVAELRDLVRTLTNEKTTRRVAA